MTILAVMGIDDDDKKHILEIAEGGSENSTIAKGLLDDLVHRGPSIFHPKLFYIIDESRALYKAITDTFGTIAFIQNAARHTRSEMCFPTYRNLNRPVYPYL